MISPQSLFDIKALCVILSMVESILLIYVCALYLQSIGWDIKQNAELVLIPSMLVTSGWMVIASIMVKE